MLILALPEPARRGFAILRKDATVVPRKPTERKPGRPKKAATEKHRDVLVTLHPDALKALDAVKKAAKDSSRSATVARLAFEARAAMPVSRKKSGP